MGVQSRIVLYAPDRTAAESAAAAGFGRIASLDAALSDYRSDSELTRLGDRAGSPPVPVSPDLFRILRFATEISAVSEGAFDSTVGPCVRLWRASRRSGQLPAADDLATARSLTSWRWIELDAWESTVRLARTGMRLDLGGIAKGYAAEAALRELAKCGCPRALVALAGDIAVGTPPPGRTGWEISRTPSAGAAPLILQHAAVSTSGDTEQFVAIDGTRYSHIVDPRTGLGATSSRVVTVVVPLDEAQPLHAGALADAAATALSTGGDGLGRRLESTFHGVRIYVDDPTATRAPSPG